VLPPFETVVKMKWWLKMLQYPTTISFRGYGISFVKLCKSYMFLQNCNIKYIKLKNHITILLVYLYSCGSQTESKKKSLKPHAKEKQHTN
jgi:hypothetical protein